jgi:hypothetical protein
MQIELCCPNCRCRFTAPPDSAGEEALDRMFTDAPCYPLGDGETLEDAIYTSLAGQDEIDCPECGRAMQVSEETLGALASTMLARM